MDEELRKLQELKALADQAKRDGQYVAATALRSLTAHANEAIVGQYGKQRAEDGDAYRNAVFLSFCQALGEDRDIQAAITGIPTGFGVIFGQGLGKLMEDIVNARG